MKLSVHLVAWNGAKYISYLFDSLRKQNFKDWFLYIVDNDSKDNTVELIKKELANFPVQYKFVQNQTNAGFAPGHNQAFRDTDGEYFLLLNQDMYLMPDCLEKMVQFLDTHSDVAAVSPRLMKWNFTSVCHSDRAQRVEESLSVDNPEKTLRDPSAALGMTNKIDALGLKIFRNRRVVEWMTQEEWGFISPSLRGSGEGEALAVFGVSGAFPMYRRTAINKILLPGGQFLDESYHSYKEDVDIAYRLAASGHKAFVLTDTVAYHDRSGAGPKETSDSAAAANKKTQSDWVKYHSYKNHLMTLYKNEYWQNFILDFPWILWYELKKLAYFALFDRKVFWGLKEIWPMRKELKVKREHIKVLRKVGWREIRKWL
ncbi:MAG: glycosyltransferase [bacterium]|nr:glycosyltransferase [bacterium]